MRTILISFTLLLVFVTACAAPPPPTEPPTPRLPPPTVQATEPPTPKLPPPTIQATEPPTPRLPPPTVPPTPLPVLLDATLPRLAEHKFVGTGLQVTEIVTATATYTTSVVTYLSDGIKISGLLNEPVGSGKFPAVVLIHGYVTPDQYTRGLDAQPSALELTKNGYITLVPDLRGYSESEHGPNLFISGWIADAINAGNALKQLPNVDNTHVGLWGHSMGGGIANRAVVVSNVFAAVVLYAPISADIDDMFMDPFGGEEAGITEALVQNLIAALDDPQFRAAISPINYLDRTTAPVSIHVGIDDTVTPKEWARAIRDGLLRANKTVEYFDYAGQGHSFKGDSLETFNTRILAFFNKYLK